MLIPTTRETVSLLRSGIFAVNKIKGVTSAETLNRLKVIIRDGLEPEFHGYPLRMGHGGTLDLSAVGVLVVGVNWGCKKLPSMLHGSKSYVVVGQLGIATDTYNETGQVIDELPCAHVKEKDLQDALKTFVGDIWQTPPVYSALKLNRRRYSDLAREGIQVTPKERKVRCYSAECTDFSPPFFTLHVRCGGGFYIRSLVHDLGKALNTCAYVRQLQRIQQGPFTLHDCLSENEWTTGNILNSILLCKLKFSQYTNRTKHKG
ncbi:unnamed protein product [Allacma fusca]|uniref:Uncharacterized protein n=1 Tax=Allacma fusca TaxID=39272 RepID=A0A8J2JFI2_9HEXA|nr:unnamed protein product [Allacma fusca]